MTKKIAVSLFGWILMLMALFVLMFYKESSFALMCLIVWAVLPFATWIMNFRAQKQISVSVKLPTTMSKNKNIKINIIVNNQSWIPAARIFCKVKLDNRLTEEATETMLIMSAAAKSNVEKIFEVSSCYCGYIDVSVSKIYLMDWVGFLPVPCKVHAQGNVSVLPDTFAPNVYLSMAMAQRDDAENWSDCLKGNDQTEVFALRDYVEGDSLKQIHWKLSSKRQQLIVREASLPIEKSLLIFWDKNTAKASPQAMDAMAECTASVAQEIYNQGISFTLGWSDGKMNAYEDIDSEDQLLQSIPWMIKWGADMESGSSAHLHRQAGVRNDFGKVIYIAKTFPEDFEQFSSGAMTMILCDSKAVSNIWPVVTFDAENYLTDLETIEL